jgi:predicted metal-dependent HD superfamily phosphohydrolase
VHDIDLTILSAPATEFDAYDRAIRLEYAHVGDAEYRAGRGALLRSFLARPRIFLTDRLHAEREAAARANIDRAIARLGGAQVTRPHP